MYTKPVAGGNSSKSGPATAPVGHKRHPPTKTGVDFSIPKMEPETSSAGRTEIQSFSRMPSQRRRRLWTLAARAAARREHPSQDKEAIHSSGSLGSKHLGESSTQSSSFLKPGTVRTQDSGISSMDYVTSREANSPNSEEAGIRQRVSLSLSTAEHPPGILRQIPSIPSQPPSMTSQDVFATSVGPRWPSVRGTKIVVSGETPVIRYANYCNAYVPEWSRRNWSSAPRPLISRQRSSMEVSYDIAPDWATSIEAINFQRSLYPLNRRLYYGRYGRASCPKATTFLEHPFPTVHMEESIEDEEEAEVAVGESEHLRRRRFETPCWCEYPPMPPARTRTYSLRGGAGTSMSMLSPYIHCSACPYRGLETGLVPMHQCDLAQRHIRRRRLKRMSSELTPPTWLTEADEAPGPPKRRPPPPEPAAIASSPPPLPRKIAQSSFSPQTERIYTEVRKISATPRTDVYLMTSESGEWRRPRRGGAGGLMRGRSVDETFYSSRPPYISEEVEGETVRSWVPVYRRFESDPLSGLKQDPHHQHYPLSSGVPFGIRKFSFYLKLT